MAQAQVALVRLQRDAHASVDEVLQHHRNVLFTIPEGVQVHQDQIALSERILLCSHTAGDPLQPVDHEPPGRGCDTLLHLVGVNVCRLHAARINDLPETPGGHLRGPSVKGLRTATTRDTAVDQVHVDRVLLQPGETLDRCFHGILILARVLGVHPFSVDLLTPLSQEREPLLSLPQMLLVHTDHTTRHRQLVTQDSVGLVDRLRALAEQAGHTIEHLLSDLTSPPLDSIGAHGRLGRADTSEALRALLPEQCADAARRETHQFLRDQGAAAERIARPLRADHLLRAEVVDRSLRVHTLHEGTELQLLHDGIEEARVERASGAHAIRFQEELGLGADHPREVLRPPSLNETDLGASDELGLHQSVGLVLRGTQGIAASQRIGTTKLQHPRREQGAHGRIAHDNTLEVQVVRPLGCHRLIVRMHKLHVSRQAVGRQSIVLGVLLQRQSDRLPGDDAEARSLGILGPDEEVPSRTTRGVEQFDTVHFHRLGEPVVQQQGVHADRLPARADRSQHIVICRR